MQGPESTSEPIAILGMGCRYPQAVGIDAFWRLLVEGRDAIGPYPGGRFRELDAEYAATAAGRGKLATNLGGFLPGLDLFDAAFFGISPREAHFVDPQQRLLLEVSWDALEDAGQVRERYQNSRTGVFIGLWNTDYEQHLYRIAQRPEFYMLTGGGRSTACGRVSFTFGFEGPSVSVDTACSSSMVAIHLACRSLQARECGMALAGGVNVILAAEQTKLFTHAGMLAPDGRCKFGNRNANGFVRSEGAGMVVLKRLSDAEAAGDPIYAVIRGSAVNNDGRSSGLMVTPSRDGQKQMLLEAWREAGIGGGDIAYIEAHGTGTHAGDPVEVGAIGDALREAGARERVPLGSLKTNIGHTESAAGVAGVIKAALVLREGVIPPSLNCTEPNPEIDWEGSPIEVATERRALRPGGGKPRFVGASSFGLTGTNAHMLLGEYPQGDAAAVADGELPSSLLLPLTGYTAASLRGNARRWVEFLERGWSAAEIAELCYLAGARRTHLPHRFAAMGRDAAELRLQLEAFLAGEASASPEAGVANDAVAGDGPVVFVAPGQGSQWEGMARELFRDNAAFRESFIACDRAVAAETGWSLIDRLGIDRLGSDRFESDRFESDRFESDRFESDRFESDRFESDEAARFLTEIDFVQPALFAMSVALAAVWRSVGVTPGAVVGHSMGEAAAAYLAGALTLGDAAAVICRRSRLMRRLSGSGSMASVELPAAELGKWLGQFEGRVSIAAENSPGTTVISGESDAVDQLLEWLELKEIFCRRIKVDVASHSVLVDPILAELEAGLADLRPRKAEIPFFSTVYGAYLDGAELDARYWVRNLREPVRLATATEALLGDGYACFVELSPHPIVAPALENTLRAAAANGALVLPSLVRGNAAWPALLRSLGRFWIAGGRLDWGVLCGRGAGRGAGRGDSPVSRRLRLPDYAFEVERFWQDEGDGAGEQAAAARLSPLLRSRTDSAQEPGTSLFSVIGDLKLLPYLADHKVGGAVVFPASAHLEVALEAARVLVPEKTVRLADVEFLQALYLSEGEASELQLVVRRVPGVAESFRFSLMGRQGGGGWTEHSKGMILLKVAGEPAPETGEFDAFDAFDAADDPGARSGSGEEHYRKALRAGLEYGPAFRLVESFRTSRVHGVLRARTLLRTIAEDGDYLLHPVLLDGCFQAIILMRSRIPGLSAEDVYLPASLGALRIFALPEFALPEFALSGAVAAAEGLTTEAVLRGLDAAAGTMEFDLLLRTVDGRLLVEASGMTVKRVESHGGDRTAEDLYLLGWKPIQAPGAATPGGAIGRHWLIFADPATGGTVSRAAELARIHTGLGGRCTLVWPGERFRALGDGERRLDLLGADEYELPLSDDVALDRLLGLVAAEAGRVSDVLDLWPLDGVDTGTGLEELMRAQGRGVKFIPALVQAITRAAWTHPPGLWLVTEGAQFVAEATGPVRLAGSTVWGLGAVVMREHPELRPCLVDLSAGEDGRETDALARLVLGETQGAEDRVALRGEMAFAERVLPCPLKTDIDELRPVAEDEAYCVEAERPGALDQLQLRVMEKVAPGAGEVVIEIAAAGLNFVDVTKALGLYPGLDPAISLKLGAECAGRVIGVGAGVAHLKLGDEVVAITPAHTRVGMLASQAVAPETLAVRVPAGMTLAEAQPLAYLTAHYSLNELARLRRGEWVLIHAGAGGVGLAAAKIALELGAKVIATASSPEKHAFLRAWGVEHVLQSRTLEFADEVMEITGGRGVDVVLNSLAGDFIAKSLEVLAPYGRFVELGKRDIYEDRRVGLKAFRKNIAYFVVDLPALVEEKPEYAAGLFREVVRAVGEGRWTRLPVTSFPVNGVVEAFQFMAQGRHIGKLAVSFAGTGSGTHSRTDLLVLPARIAAGTPSEPRFRSDGSYIITGGLGGVGSAVAEWLAANGAACVVLVSRREAGEAEQAVMRRARVLGARVEHRRTDLLDRRAVEELVSEIGREMPPLRGIFHAAAVIDDALVTDLRPERFDAVLGPKMRGTWHLHEATLDLNLDFFVMFSSVASIFPQPGHGSYAAANSFLDSFAGYRRGLGLAGSSINWTGWIGLGLARNMGTRGTIEASSADGLGSFDRDEALAALGQALWADPVQATAVRIDADGVVANAVNAMNDAIPTLLREVVGPEASRNAGSTASAEHPALIGLAGAGTHGERMLVLEQLLRIETGRVLKLAPERIGANQPFGQLGIDSLMALELIRRVNAALGLALPATAVFNYPTLTQLAAQILKRLGLDAAPAAEAAMQPPSGAVRGDAEELSEDEALRALMEPGDPSSGD
jgi:acyl transferase domain-containing protein/NADPH:quinone reductase-like Zn-dependent oxidoreductase/acyl carrier protein